MKTLQQFFFSLRCREYILFATLACAKYHTHVFVEFRTKPIPTILPSLATVPQASAVYPEDFYTGGSYTELPYGRVSVLWILTSNKAEKSDLCRRAIGY